jgi:hypothetical protein
MYDRSNPYQEITPTSRRLGLHPQFVTRLYFFLLLQLSTIPKAVLLQLLFSVWFAKKSEEAD